MMRKMILALSCVAMATTPAWAEIARIKRATGTTSIERGTAQLQPTPGFKLLAGDKLITGKDGQLSLSFVDDTRFSIGPNSRIDVSTYEYNRATQAGSFVTQVNRGSLAVVSGQIAHSGRDAMKVRTPTSLLGVRGTRFIVEVQ